MAAPQSRPVAARGPAQGPVRRKRPEGRKDGAGSWRAFAVLVLVPAALMLGSVYAHTAAVATGAEAARLEEEKVLAEAERERLEVQVAELSESAIVREEARESLGMKDPGGKDLWTYGSEGEDVVDGGEESKKGAGE